MMLLSSSSSHPSSVPSFLSLTFIIAVFLNFSAYASPVPHSLSTPATLSAPLPDLYLEKRVGIKDSFDADKIVAWLEKNKPADPSKLIFYTDVKVGKAMAATFCEHNPTYGYFYSIYGAAFAKDMGLVNGVYPPANLIVMSIAMGKWATGVTRVFNSQNAKSTAYWVQHEMPELKKRAEVTHIYTMRDNAIVASDYGLDIKH